MEINNRPPVVFARNEFGLRTDIQYVFKPDGKVDWLAMIPREYIVPNSEKTQETDISKLENKDLLILLDGFKRVASIRGFNSIRRSVCAPDINFVAMETFIEWIPNYETENRAVVTSGTADAHVGSTKSFAVNFLTTIAENRSFVRAVRFFLEIPVLGKDEMGFATINDVANGSSSTSQSEGHEALTELLKVNNIKFENFKNRMIQLNVEGAKEWQTVSDVPKNSIFEVITHVKTLLKARQQAQPSKDQAK